MRIRHLLPLGVFLALAILLGVGLTLNPREVPSPLIGKPVPAFSVPALNDATQQISHQTFAGQVTLFNVWASWCVSCRDEHPLLVALAQHNEVTIYGLNYKDDASAARRWLDEHGNPYRDSAFDQNGRVGMDLGVYGVPETFVVDRQGIIRYKHIGPLTAGALEQKILPLVRELKTAP
jgi:cytochrome c biogenesis protein CcmG/thiol:disulfide interchange protein DsbE